MKSLRFSDKWSYKVARRISKIDPVYADSINIALPVHYFTADNVQYSFPRTQVNIVGLFEPCRIDTIAPEEYVLSNGNSINFELLQKVSVFQADSYLADIPNISENLFIPLGRQQVKGKKYCVFPQSDEEETSSLFPDFQTRSKGEEKGLRKSFKTLNKTTRRGPDIWDMLFPILQPPINEAFTDLLDLPPRCQPRPYQWEGIKFLVEREAALLGDDMGTGKTIQSILAARFLFQSGKIRKALFLAPVSVLPNWDREFEKWAPSLKVTFVRGNPETRQTCWDVPAHAWVTTYDTLRQDIDYLKSKNSLEFDLVVLDEAQKIKNPGTGLSKSVRQLRAKHRWGLSGTPIENKLEELSAIFSFLKPQLFPKDFSSNQATQIIKPYFLRRRKADVLPELPLLTEYPIWIQLTDGQQQTYDKLEKEQVVELYNKGKTITAQNILTLIMELKKVCNRDPDTEKSAKLVWLNENLEDMIGEDNKVLVFTQFRVEDCGGSEWLEENLKSYGALNYCRATTDRSRNEMLRNFTNNPDKRVFIGNPRTAGVGINELKCANYVVHFDHWWNPAVTNQATARSHRPGQMKNVTVYHLWVENTIEEMILSKTVSKQKLYDEVIDSLSSEVTSDVLFEVYDELLVKHGFQPLHSGKSTSNDSGITTMKHQVRAKIQTPREFEESVSCLFDAMGYRTQLTPYSHDGGVDVIATREIGYSVEKIAIQCKFQKSPVGRPVLQQLLGVISSDTAYSKGYLVTNNDMSREAYDLIQNNGRLQVITGKELVRLFDNYNIDKKL